MPATLESKVLQKLKEKFPDKEIEIVTRTTLDFRPLKVIIVNGKRLKLGLDIEQIRDTVNIVNHLKKFKHLNIEDEIVDSISSAIQTHKVTLKDKLKSFSVKKKYLKYRNERRRQ